MKENTWMIREVLIAIFQKDKTLSDPWNDNN